MDTEEAQCVQQELEPAADTEQLPTALAPEQEEWVGASKGATEVVVVVDTEVECKYQIESIVFSHLCPTRKTTKIFNV